MPLQGTGGIVYGGLSIVLAGLAVLINVCEVSLSSQLCTGCSLKTSNLIWSSHDILLLAANELVVIGSSEASSLVYGGPCDLVLG